MQITVHLHADVARRIAERNSPTAETTELMQILSQFGVKLEPLHPDTDDPELVTHFWISVPDQVTAERLTQQLSHLKAIQAAYVKPPDAMP